MRYLSISCVVLLLSLGLVQAQYRQLPRAHGGQFSAVAPATMQWAQQQQQWNAYQAQMLQYVSVPQPYLYQQYLYNPWTTAANCAPSRQQQMYQAGWSPAYTPFNSTMMPYTPVRPAVAAPAAVWQAGVAAKSPYVPYTPTWRAFVPTGPAVATPMAIWQAGVVVKSPYD